MPGGCGLVADSKACLPSRSGKAWLTTGRSLPSSTSPASFASSAASGVTMKNMACTPSAAALSEDGGALSVTSRPPRRVSS